MERVMHKPYHLFIPFIQLYSSNISSIITTNEFLMPNITQKCALYLTVVVEPN